MAARRTTGTAAGRDNKVRSRASSEEQAPAPQAGGLGFVDAVTIATTLVLVAAWLMMDKVLGEHFGSGTFFKP